MNTELGLHFSLSQHALHSYVVKINIASIHDMNNSELHSVCLPSRHLTSIKQIISQNYSGVQKISATIGYLFYDDAPYVLVIHSATIKSDSNDWLLILR